MSTLKNQITEDMKTAMRAKDSAKLLTIRMLLAAIKQKEVDERIELTDADVVRVVDKLMKQRRDSIDQFTKASRMDLVENETAELKVLELYMPVRMTESEINTVVAQVVSELGATSASDMGKVMGKVKALLADKADMSIVSKAVKSALTK